MSDGTPSWSLENAEQISEQYPYTFYKPSSAVIGMLRPGNHVKLIFLFHSDDPEAPRAERMWVTIDAIEGSVYRGTLENQPLHIKDLQAGHTIAFTTLHIIDTDIADPVPSIVDKYAARCFVTRRILDGGSPVGYLYREEPERDEDSGWRIMTGDETPEYMDDAANIAWVSLGAVLREDDSIVHLLEAPAGSAYERRPGTDRFVPVAEERGF